MSLFDHELNPIPPGAVAGEIGVADGTRLRFARWLPSTPHPKGTICLLQGRAEFIERYFETVRDLLARGFAVATFDWRGQGGSSNRPRVAVRGHVDDFDEFAADLDGFMSQVVLTDCPPPYYALAHSTGGTVLLRSAPSMRTRFRRLVLLSPLLGLGEHGWPDGMVAPLAGFLAMVGFAQSPIPGGQMHTLLGRPFEGNRLTCDAARFERTQAVIAMHPQLAIGPPTIGWIRAATTAFAELDDPDFVDRIRIPTLMVAAGADRVVSLAATERFGRGFKMGDLIVVPGARHELLQEADIYREQMFAAFDAFVPGS